LEPVAAWNQTAAVILADAHNQNNRDRTLQRFRFDAGFRSAPQSHLADQCAFNGEVLMSTVSAFRHRLWLILAIFLLAGCGSVEDRAQGHYERGMKLLELHDYVKASLEFRNAVKLKKDLLGAWRGLSQVEEHNQNWEGLTGSCVRLLIWIPLTLRQGCG